MNPLIGSLDSAMPLLYRASWQAGVLAVVVFAVCRSCPRIPARWRCVLWSVVLMRLLLPVLPPSEASLFNVAHPPIASTEQPVIEVSPGIAPESEPEDAVTLTPYEENTTPAVIPQSEPMELQEFDPVSTDQTSNEAVPSDEPIERSTSEAFQVPWPALTYVWLTGVGLMFLREMLQQFRLKRQLGRCRNASDTSLLDILSSCRREMGLRRNVRLLVTSDLVGPAVTGIFRPAIILPAHVVKSLDEAELRWLLCHELAHIRRRDTLTYAVWRLARAIHWFNPLAWLAASSVKTSAESASDERVLSSAATQKYIEYGQSLLRVAELLTEWKPVPTAVGIFSRRDNLRRRITMIADYRKPSRIWTLIAATGVLVLVLTGLTDAMKPGEEVVNDAGASEPLTETAFDPVNPPTVEEIAQAVIANREQIRSLHVRECRRWHGEVTLFQEVYLDADAYRWRVDTGGFGPDESWDSEDPFARMSEALMSKLSVDGDNIYSHIIIAAMIRSLDKKLAEERPPYFSDPRSAGLTLKRYEVGPAFEWGEGDAMNLGKAYDGTDGCLDMTCDLLKASESGLATVVAGRWEDEECWNIEWEAADDENQRMKAYKCVVVPDWNWSIVSLSMESKKEGETAADLFCSMETEVALHEESGMWFPRSFHYEQEYQEETIMDEETSIQVVSLNEPLPEELFTLTGMGLKAEEVVIDQTGEEERQGTWDGEKVVWPTPLEVTVDEFGDISVELEIDFSGELVLENNSARACVEQLREFIKTQDEEEWKTYGLWAWDDDAHIDVFGTTDEQVEILEALVKEFDAEPVESLKQEPRLRQTYPLKQIPAEAAFVLLNDWMRSDERMESCIENFSGFFDSEKREYIFTGTKDQHELVQAKIAEIDVESKENANEYVVHHLQYVAGKKALESLNAMMEGEQGEWEDCRVIIYEDLNMMLVHGTKIQQEEIAAKISGIDVPLRQIQMEMTLIEVDLDGEESGVLQRLVNEKKETMEPDEALAAAIQELTDGDRAEVLSRPVIRTLDGHQATIQIGEVVPITSEDGSITHEEIGWLIEATPHLTEEGRIRTEYLVLHSCLSEQDGNVTSRQIEFECEYLPGQVDFDPVSLHEGDGTEFVIVVTAEVVVEEE